MGPADSLGRCTGTQASFPNKSEKDEGRSWVALRKGSFAPSPLAVQFRVFTEQTGQQAIKRTEARFPSSIAICQSFGRSEIPSSCSSESECELKMHGWVVFFVILRFSFCHGSREEPERTSNDHGQYCTMQRGMFYLCTCLCHVDTLPMTASDLVAVSSRCTDSPEALRSRCSEKAGTCPHALHRLE